MPNTLPAYIPKPEDDVESEELCALLVDLRRHRRAAHPAGELLPIVRASDLASARPADPIAAEMKRRIREIGEAMHRRGGLPAMMSAYRRVQDHTDGCERSLDKIWHGIGTWLA